VISPRADDVTLLLEELRYFAGLDVAETARVLGVSTATVKRDWRDARIWLRLRRAMAAGEEGG
jgi:DNA-directed RNA polymerase specialized sigma24 family protein